MLMRAMIKHGLTPEEAESRFWMLDRGGLITEERAQDPRGGVSPQAARFARKKRKSLSSSPRPGEEDLESDIDRDGETLLEVVRRVKPTVLIGLSGAGRIFTREVLEAAAAGVERPVVFAASNPTSRSECTSLEAASATGGRAIFASGSPQPDVTLINEKQQVMSIASSQANNVFVFPGVGLGAMVAHARELTDGMFMAAASALAEMVTPERLAQGAIYPALSDLRAVSRRIAIAVAREARDRGLGRLAADGEIEAAVDATMWDPVYEPAPTP